ncbi:Hypothetical protein D9617_28g065060 [Elsinoe fawcettii]|nr:Hypothetical protein D9617_28g065060 [Elsinoe fawcettii]
MGISPGAPSRRIVTGHLNDKSVVIEDENLDLIHGFGSNARTIWSTSQHPAELHDTVPKELSVKMYTKGSLIRVVDFPAKSQGHNHRTASLDYAIVLDGELELLLEDGSKTVCRAGDIAVQQATMHQWNNVTDKPARIAFILMPSEKPVLNGVVVGEAGVPQQFLPD